LIYRFWGRYKNMLNSIAQFTRNRYLSAAGSGSRLGARVWFRLEKMLVKWGDPLVSHRLGRFTIKLPLSHALPRFHLIFPQYSLNLGRIGAAMVNKYADLRAIDVGANVGDSVAIMRQGATYPILCVEAEDAFFRTLSENARQFSDLVLVKGYLGEADTELAGKLDASHGTANLNSTSGERVQVQTLSTLMRQYPEFEGAKLLKIDTDGYDNKIIRGAVEFLKRARPAVFFEYDPYFLSLQKDDGLSIFPLLRGLGYHQLLVYDNFGTLAETIELSDETGLVKMHQRQVGHGGAKYVDLCAFHADDDDVFQTLRHSEAALGAQT